MNKQLTASTVTALDVARAEVEAAHINYLNAARTALPVGATVHFTQLRQMRNYSGRIVRINMHGGDPEIWIRNLKTLNSQKFYVFEIIEAVEKGQLVVDLSTVEQPS